MKPEPLASQFDFLPGERQDMEFLEGTSCTFQTVAEVVTEPVAESHLMAFSHTWAGVIPL